MIRTSIRRLSVSRDSTMTWMRVRTGNHLSQTLMIFQISLTVLTETQMKMLLAFPVTVKKRNNSLRTYSESMMLGSRFQLKVILVN